MFTFIKRRLLEVFKANRRPLFILSIGCVLIFLNIGRRLRGDSELYEGLSLSLLGREAPSYYYSHRSLVIMRPIVPVLASPLILISDNVDLSFGLVSGLFWIGGAIVAYKLGQILFQDDDLALLTALSYVTAPTLLMWGAAVMTDSAGFFFIGLTVYLTLKREQQEHVSSKTYFLDALIASIGVLSRESVVAALVFMIARRFMRKKGFKETLIATFLVGISTVFSLSLLGFGPDVFIHKYVLATRVHTWLHENWGLLSYISNLGRAFVTNIALPSPYFVSFNFWIGMLPFLFYGTCTLIGLIYGARQKDLIFCLLVLFPTSMIWPAMRERFSFCMWPAIIPAFLSGMNLILSRLSFVRPKTQHRSKICILLYVSVFGVINTLTTLVYYGSLTTTLQ